MQIQKLKEEKRNVLKEKEILEQQNEQLRQKQADAIPIEVLRKVFTSGQIAKLKSSTNSRIRWSSEDIVSAISLRAVSSKTYRYLRNVKKMPLPCTYKYFAKLD